MIDPGKLIHRVSLEAPTSQRDSFGQEKDSWSVEADLFSEVITLGGRQLEFAQKTVATATHSVRIRWRDGVTTAKRFRFRGKILNIEHVGDNYAEDEMLCTCVEVR